jgi:hypothetical protein
VSFRNGSSEARSFELQDEFHRVFDGAAWHFCSMVVFVAR